MMTGRIQLYDNSVFMLMFMYPVKYFPQIYGQHATLFWPMCLILIELIGIISLFLLIANAYANTLQQKIQNFPLYI